MSQRYRAVLLHGHAVADAAHAPFQHSTGANAGHCAAHLDASVTQSCSLDASESPSTLALQRYGVADGHGHPSAVAAQLPSQHRTGALFEQLALHSAALVVHTRTPVAADAALAHRYGVCGAHAHCAALATQLLSQHWTSDDGQLTQRDSDAAHSPLVGHVTCPTAHRWTHVLLNIVHELLDAHCASDVADAHGTDVTLRHTYCGLPSESISSHEQPAFSCVLQASSERSSGHGMTFWQCSAVAFQVHTRGNDLHTM